MIRVALHWLPLILSWIAVALWAFKWRVERLERRHWEHTAREWEHLTLEVLRGGRDMAASILLLQQEGLLDEREEELRTLVRDLSDQLSKAEEHIV